MIDIDRTIGKIVGFAMAHGITIEGWHPMVAHFALALPVVAALFWLFGGAKNASFTSPPNLLFFLGYLAVVAAFVTGRAIGTDAGILLSPGGKALFEQHLQMGNILALFYTLLAAVQLIDLISKKRSLGSLVTLLMVAGAAALLYQATIGEEMVYAYGAGVSPPQ